MACGLFDGDGFLGNNLERETESEKEDESPKPLTRPSESSRIVFLISLPVENHFVVRNFKFVGGSTEISFTSELQI